MQGRARTRCRSGSCTGITESGARSMRTSLRTLAHAQTAIQTLVIHRLMSLTEDNTGHYLFDV